MVRPQIGDGGMVSNKEGSYEYIEQAVANNRQVVGAGRGDNNS